MLVTQLCKIKGYCALPHFKINIINLLVFLSIFIFAGIYHCSRCKLLCIICYYFLNLFLLVPFWFPAVLAFWLAPLTPPPFLSYWQKRVCDGDDLGRKMPNRSWKTCQQPRVVFVRDTPFVAVGCTCCFIVNTNQNLSDPRRRDQLQKFSKQARLMRRKKNDMTKQNKIFI